MNKHTILVCEYCHCSSEELLEKQRKDGTRLLEQLNTLSKKKFPSAQLEIKPVGCMAVCNHGCVVAVSSPEKYTYLFLDLPLDESAAALLEFMQIYISNDKGRIPSKQFPELLQSGLFVRIPPVLIDENIG